MTRSEITLSIVSALLSFLGALAGVYAGSRFEQSNWEARFHLEQKRLVLDRRIALVERMMVVLNKVPLMKGLQSSLEAEKELSRLAVYCASSTANAKKPGCLTTRQADTKHVEEIGREIYTLNAEWAASASLAAMYFGKNTRVAIQEIKGTGLWMASDEQRQKIIDAMSVEINHFDQ